MALRTLRKWLEEDENHRKVESIILTRKTDTDVETCDKFLHIWFPTEIIKVYYICIEFDCDPIDVNYIDDNYTIVYLFSRCRFTLPRFVWVECWKIWDKLYWSQIDWKLAFIFHIWNLHRNLVQAEIEKESDAGKLEEKREKKKVGKKMK